MNIRIIAPQMFVRRLLETILLVVGIVFLGIYFYSFFYRTAYQIYEGWRFQHETADESPSVSKPMPVVLPDPDRAPPARLPDAGSIIGRISIPRLHISAMVEEGVDDTTLSRAVGHIPGTSLPGRSGNVGIAAHRDTFFRGLKDLQPNDRIDFTTHSGRFHYVVESLRIVDPSDVSVLKPGDGRSLTLVTCFPFEYIGHAPRRFIVHAVSE